MTKHRKKKKQPRRASSPGSPPGTLVTHQQARASVDVIAWSADNFVRKSITKLDEAISLNGQYDVVWINVIGLNDTRLLAAIGKQFHIHQLSLEDIINVGQRSKYEAFEGYNYIVTRMCYDDPYCSEQLSVLHVNKTVITFQEFVGDCLGPLRQRIEQSNGQIRNRGSDYLVYAIVDSVLDHYYPVVESFADRLDEIDEQLTDDKAGVSLAEVHGLRRDLLDIRRWLKPHREMLSQLMREESSAMSADTQVYMRDCYDHVIQLTENIEIYLEACADLRDFHFNAVSNRTNEVMKTLTIISTIFIPLSFIAGIYGMNFESMPGIGSGFGFWATIIGMIVIACSLLFWFRHRGWFRV